MNISVTRKRVTAGLFSIILVTLIGCGGILGTVDKVSNSDTKVDIVKEETDLPVVELSLIMVDGDQQRGFINSPLAKPLTVQVIDLTSGNPVANKEIKFEVSSGAAQVVSSVQTDDEGMAKTNVILGNQASEVQITATLVSEAKDLNFVAYSRSNILKQLAGPGLNGSINCVAESQEYADLFVFQLSDSENFPSLDVDILVKVDNGSINEAPFEIAKTFTSNQNGEVEFKVLAGNVLNSDYKSKVTVTVDVPSMVNVDPIVSVLDVSKSKYIVPLSVTPQYSDNIPGNNVWPFNFSVQIKEACDVPAADERVTFDIRSSVPIDFPCIWREDNHLIEEWSFFQHVQTDQDGIATLSTELGVRHPRTQFVFPWLHQIQATGIGTDSLLFEATSGVCNE